MQSGDGNPVVVLDGDTGVMYHLDFWGPRMDLFHGWPGWRHNQFWAPVDIIEEDDRLVLKAAVPGFKAENFDLTIEDNILTIKGETSSETSDEVGNYLHRERMLRRFPALLPPPRTRGHRQGREHLRRRDVVISFPYREDMAPKQMKIEVGTGTGDAS